MTMDKAEAVKQWNETWRWGYPHMSRVQFAQMQIEAMIMLCGKLDGEVLEEILTWLDEEK